MTLKKQYTEEIILDGIDYKIPRTTLAIANHVGCSKRTVDRIILAMEAIERVSRVVVETGKDTQVVGWLKVGLIAGITDIEALEKLAEYNETGLETLVGRPYSEDIATISATIAYIKEYDDEKDCVMECVIDRTGIKVLYNAEPEFLYFVVKP
jgi:hypothetical protein